VWKITYRCNKHVLINNITAKTTELHTWVYNKLKYGEVCDIQ